MHEKLVAPRTAACLLGGSLAIFVAPIGAAIAFPFVDPSNQATVQTGMPGGIGTAAPAGTELPAQDTGGLRKQLRLTNPAGAGNPSAWTIEPRLTVQQMFTDNAFEATSPRRFDAVTAVSPGLSIKADTNRLQLSFDYQPSLIMHAVEGPLNNLSQQLNAVGLFTVVPDLFYVDMRALSGVQSRLGAVAGTGTLGGTGAGFAPAGSGSGVFGQGVNRRNQVQNSTIGISPYFLTQFGDYGTGKLGASINASRYATVSGFVSSPLPTGGINGQSLVTTEQIAQFTTGTFLSRIQDSISVDLSQSNSQYDSIGTVPGSKFHSERYTVNNQISYVLNRYFSLLGSIGYQNITYSGGNAQNVNGIIWNAGVTVTPGPDSSLTITYGRLNGVNAFNANGHYALTARTLLSTSYTNTVGTQLENVQHLFNASTIGVNGQLINAQTGGPNFLAANALGAQTGVYRYQTLNSSVVTTWQRDTFQAAFTWSIQTTLSPGSVLTTAFVDPVTGNVNFFTQGLAGTGQSTDVKSGSVSWTHELTPDLSLSSSAAYTFIRRPANGGNDGTVSTAVALQYAMSEATTLSARYAFFDRVSRIPGYSLYENIVLLGITKRF